MIYIVKKLSFYFERFIDNVNEGDTKTFTHSEKARMQYASKLTYIYRSVIELNQLYVVTVVITPLFKLSWIINNLI